MRDISVIGWSLEQIMEYIQKLGYTPVKPEKEDIIPVVLRLMDDKAFVIDINNYYMEIGRKKKKLSLKADSIDEWFMIDFLTPTKVVINGKTKEYDEGDFITVRSAEIEVISGEIKVRKYKGLKEVENEHLR